MNGGAFWLRCLATMLDRWITAESGISMQVFDCAICVQFGERLTKRNTQLSYFVVALTDVIMSSISGVRASMGCECVMLRVLT